MIDSTPDYWQSNKAIQESKLDAKRIDWQKSNQTLLYL
jgi:hypothetical protein